MDIKYQIIEILYLLCSTCTIRNNIIKIENDKLKTTELITIYNYNESNFT